MFQKILIANRGEIACRIIKTARRMGIQTVAIYSTADNDALHVSLADEALCIGAPPARDSYLNIEAIVSAALECGAEAIHPGYGFLSENPSFAKACMDAGLTFIGPSVSAMTIMGSKQLAKQCLENTSVPLTPGYHGALQSDAQLLIEAQKIGFPLLIKAACGGGGKGMRTTLKDTDFLKDLASARREATACFGDDTMLLEKLIQHPRHVEIQIMADNHGHIVHLFERDCSIQRRHQKIIEEAPAPDLSPALRAQLAEAALAVARTIDYRGAGTIEFLVEQDRCYFMEMNTRLQVEHPVTEMITGLDLVEWQFRIAANEPLPRTQKELTYHGHAIECRIYAEDPRQGFMPSMGQLHLVQEPSGDGVRLDSSVTQDAVITPYYDPMIAKLITWGNTRAEALHRLQVALTHYHIAGIKTNIPFLQAITTHPSFISANLSTQFLDHHPLVLPEPDTRTALLMASCFDYITAQHAGSDPLLQDTFAWQMHLPSHWKMTYLIHGTPKEVVITPISPNELTVTVAEETFSLSVFFDNQTVTIRTPKQQWKALIEDTPTHLSIYTSDGSIIVERFEWQHLTSQTQLPNSQLTAPMPATVVAILKTKGEVITMGERLMVLEAMKMEHTILSPKAGVITDIFYDIGAQVHEGATLLAIE